MADLRGTPVIYNAKNISVGSIIVALKGKNLSTDFGREADFQGFNDDEGDIMSEAVTTKRKTLSIRVVPYGKADAGPPILTGDRVQANENLQAMLAEPGDVAVVLDGEDDNGGADGWDSPIDSSGGTNYSVRSSRLGRTSEGLATIDLELIEYQALDITNGPIT